MKYPSSTFRKNINRKQTGRDARDGKVIKKQSSVNSTTLSTNSQVILTEDFNEEIFEEIRNVIPKYADGVHELYQTYSKGIIVDILLIHKQSTHNYFLKPIMLPQISSG